MINYIQKDLTTVERGIIAHGVNCQGAMGSGVAGAIRRKWPGVYDSYRSYVDKHMETFGKSEYLLGKVHTYHVSSDLVIANCFTQNYYGKNPNVKYASPEAIRLSLQYVFEISQATELLIYMPMIGCGLGGLRWDDDVKPIVTDLYNSHNAELYICDV